MIATPTPSDRREYEKPVNAVIDYIRERHRLGSRVRLVAAEERPP